MLVLKKITNEVQPSAMVFDTTPFWIRIYDLPRIGREVATIRQIGARFGEVLEIDHTTLSGITQSVRVSTDSSR